MLVIVPTHCFVKKLNRHVLVILSMKWWVTNANLYVHQDGRELGRFAKRFFVRETTFPAKRGRGKCIAAQKTSSAQVEMMCMVG
jgi:hypothetical protein